MCDRGTDKEVVVLIPADLSHTGKERWARIKIDSCIAPIVDALSKAGIHMRGSFVGTVKGMETFIFRTVGY